MAPRGLAVFSLTDPLPTPRGAECAREPPSAAPVPTLRSRASALMTSAAQSPPFLWALAQTAHWVPAPGVFTNPATQAKCRETVAKSSRSRPPPAPSLPYSALSSFPPPSPTASNWLPDQTVLPPAPTAPSQSCSAPHDPLGFTAGLRVTWARSQISTMRQTYYDCSWPNYSASLTSGFCDN